MGQFGDKFRKEREKKDLSLDDVSNVTKISARMLQAIEQEHFDLLPGGVFNRGFIRAYAKHLGLNGEDAVTDYLACLRQAQIDANAAWEPELRSPASANLPSRAPYTKPAIEKKPVFEKQPQPPQPPPARVEELPELQLPRAEDVRPPRRNYGEKRGPKIPIPWTIVAPAALILVLLFFLWGRHFGNTQNQAANAPAPSTPAIQSVPSATPAPIAAARSSSPPSHPAATVASSPHQPPVTQPSITQSSATQPPPAPPAVTAHASTPPATKSQPSGESAAENDVTVRTFPAANPKISPSRTSSPAAAPFTLVIRATETSWISVTADGKSVSDETLIAPAHTSIRASHEIVARVGNAAGVSFLLNGKEIPAQGAESEAKTFIFDASGMRIAPNQPPVPNQ